MWFYSIYLILARFTLILAWYPCLWPTRHSEKVQHRLRCHQRGIWTHNFLSMWQLSNIANISCGPFEACESMTAESFHVVGQQTATMVLDTKCVSLFISPYTNSNSLCPNTTVSADSFSDCDLKKPDVNFSWFFFYSGMIHIATKLFRTISGASRI